MKPVLEQNKIRKSQYIIYAIIIIVCIIIISISLYLQYYKDQKIELIFGITGKDSEEEDRYNELKNEFATLFTNKVENLQQEEINVEKISNNYGIIAEAYKYEKNEENRTINVIIPYININTNLAKSYNKEISLEIKEKAEKFMKETSDTNIVYTVEYIGYIQNNILSLVIQAELKEGNKSQKIWIKTYNYNLLTNEEVTLEQLLQIKNITIEAASNKVKEEIKSIQEKNATFLEQGYNLYKRDYTSSIYNIENTENYFLGKDGMLYLVYAYGNKDYTSERDIVIFK